VAYWEKHLLAIEGLTPPEIGHLLATEHRCDAEPDELRPAVVRHDRSGVPSMI
jgi:hypothetical protein